MRRRGSPAGAHLLVLIASLGAATGCVTPGSQVERPRAEGQRETAQRETSQRETSQRETGQHGKPAPAAARTNGAQPEAIGAAVAVPAQDPQLGERRTRVVPKERIRFDDGDTVDIVWDERVETVRILGIDTPEVLHPEHKLPLPQPFGERAAGFLEGCLAMSTKVELLDREQTDPYGRTLGYLLLDGRNYSTLVLKAGLAAESVSFYGDNGFPAEAAACLAAAKEAPPLPFEPPHLWRKRLREWVDHTNAQRERDKR